MTSLASSSAPVSITKTTPPSLWQRIRRILNSYTVRVMAQGLLTIFGVISFTFFLIRLMPGNPVEIKIEQFMQRGLTFEEASNQAAALYQFDPDAPILQQYVDYIGKLLQGNLGESITSPGTTVISQILRYLPWTLFSVGTALLISFSLGVLLGMAMAYWRGSLFDNIVTIIASFIYGIPDYVIALLLIIVVGIQLKIFSPGEMRGGVDPTIAPGFTFEYIGSIFKFAMLPVLVYVLSSIGGWILTMKSSTIATLGEDHITVAKARGLSERRILTAYVGRNALLPLVTRLAISIGFVVGGSVIIEELFQYPGIGRNLLRVITSRDYTTMQGFFLIITISVVVSNIISDLALGWLDPRVRVKNEKKD
ncbi:MAG: ABC transporter permease [Anaerolineae bacterium]|nr:ABC transporter permease [Anaerolineae bacterium]